MSLSIPDSLYEQYNIVAIDPGSNNIGFCIYTIDPKTNTPIAIKAFTIIVDYLLDSDLYDSDIQTERMGKLLKIYKELFRLFSFYNPRVVVCESPFYNSFRPAAFGSLVEVLNTIYNAVLNYNSTTLFFTIEPSVIKKNIGAGYIADKILVKDAVKNKKEITSILSCNIDLLDEHAIDAIAIGKTFLNLTNKGI